MKYFFRFFYILGFTWGLNAFAVTNRLDIASVQIPTIDSVVLSDVDNSDGLFAITRAAYADAQVQVVALDLDGNIDQDAYGQVNLILRGRYEGALYSFITQMQAGVAVVNLDDRVVVADDYWLEGYLADAAINSADLLNADVLRVLPQAVARHIQLSSNKNHISDQQIAGAGAILQVSLRDDYGNLVRPSKDTAVLVKETSGSDQLALNQVLVTIPAGQAEAELSLANGLETEINLKASFLNLQAEEKLQAEKNLSLYAGFSVENATAQADTVYSSPINLYVHPAHLVALVTDDFKVPVTVSNEIAAFNIRNPNGDIPELYGLIVEHWAKPLGASATVRLERSVANYDSETGIASVSFRRSSPVIAAAKDEYYRLYSTYLGEAIVTNIGNDTQADILPASHARMVLRNAHQSPVSYIPITQNIDRLTLNFPNNALKGIDSFGNSDTLAELLSSISGNTSLRANIQVLPAFANTDTRIEANYPSPFSGYDTIRLNFDNLNLDTLNIQSGLVIKALDKHIAKQGINFMDAPLLSLLQNETPNIPGYTVNNNFRGLGAELRNPYIIGIGASANGGALQTTLDNVDAYQMISMRATIQVSRDHHRNQGRYLVLTAIISPYLPEPILFYFNGANTPHRWDGNISNLRPYGEERVTLDANQRINMNIFDGLGLGGVPATILVYPMYQLVDIDGEGISDYFGTKAIRLNVVR